MLRRLWSLRRRLLQGRVTLVVQWTLAEWYLECLNRFHAHPMPELMSRRRCSSSNNSNSLQHGSFVFVVGIGRRSRRQTRASRCPPSAGLHQHQTHRP